VILGPRIISSSGDFGQFDEGYYDGVVTTLVRTWGIMVEIISVVHLGNNLMGIIATMALTMVGIGIMAEAVLRGLRLIVMEEVLLQRLLTSQVRSLRLWTQRLCVSLPWCRWLLDLLLSRNRSPWMLLWVMLREVPKELRQTRLYVSVVIRMVTGRMFALLFYVCTVSMLLMRPRIVIC
jgi:hypothetical protein